MRVLDALVVADHRTEILSFRIDEGVRSLDISASGQERGTRLLVVLNPAGGFVADIILGLGTFPRRAYVSRDKASINAVRQPIRPGLYSILVFSAAAPGTDPTVTVRVEADGNGDGFPEDCLQAVPWFSPDERVLDYRSARIPETRYYRGDFHAHTRLSDGENPLPRAGELARSRGLDFIAFTEHNRVAGGAPELGLLPIPSFELTLSQGHFNIHGLNRPLFHPGVLDILSSSKSEDELLDRLLDEFGSECNRSINHPFLSPWEVRRADLDLGRIDTLEVLCDPAYPTAPAANDRAVAFLDHLWNEGFRIYGIGGSDCHLSPENRYEGSAIPSVYGDPSTYVFCAGLSVENILTALRRGNCYVSRFVVLDIQIEQGRILPGNRVPDDIERVRYGVRVLGCPPGWKARFVADGATLRETESSGEAFAVLQEAETKSFRWLRFGLVDESGHAAAYVNPIYRGERGRKPGRFGELVKNMEGNRIST